MTPVDFHNSFQFGIFSKEKTAVTINKKCTYTKSFSRDALSCSHLQAYVKSKSSKNEEKDAHVEYTEKG